MVREDESAAHAWCGVDEYSRAIVNSEMVKPGS